MKASYDGKSRLAGQLDSEGRAALCLLLLEHVLKVVAQVPTVNETWVVGGDEWVRNIALEQSARWHPEPGLGLNEAIRYAALKAFDEGSGAVLVLPGDLGIIQPDDVDHLITLSNGMTRVVLARAATDGGTNAILSPRGFMVDPNFGPDSFRNHLKVAHKVKATVEISSRPGLSFDLDTPKDMIAYQARRPDLQHQLEAWRLRIRSKISTGGI